MNRSILWAGVILPVALAFPAMAVESPVVWRDEDTGCAYLLTAQGGISPRYRRNGTLDCPDVVTGRGIVDDTAQGIERGLDVLQDQINRLRQRNDERP